MRFLKKGLSVSLILCLLLSALAGCARETAEETPEANPIDGFETEGEVTGGGTLQNANLSSVQVTEENGDVRLTLAFIGGSRISGGTDEREPANVPHFSVRMLPQPARLAVSFDSITYWDYLRGLDLSASDFPLGSFGTVFAGSEAFTLYFELSGDAAFQVEEKKRASRSCSAPLQRKKRSRARR